MLVGSGAGFDCRSLPTTALLSFHVHVGPAVWVPTGCLESVSKSVASGSWKVHWKAASLAVHL